MIIILITLADGEQLYTQSLRINELGDVVTDDSIFDPTNIKKTEILWVDTEEFKLQGIPKV